MLSRAVVGRSSLRRIGASRDANDARRRARLALRLARDDCEPRRCRLRPPRLSPSASGAVQAPQLGLLPLP